MNKLSLLRGTIISTLFVAFIGTVWVCLAIHRYEVVAVREGTIKIDRLTGDSWILGFSNIGKSDSSISTWLEVPTRNLNRDKIRSFINSESNTQTALSA